jgi:hypothetical protein
MTKNPIVPLGRGHLRSYLLLYIYPEFSLKIDENPGFTTQISLSIKGY